MGRSELHYASSDGKVPDAARLIKAGYDVNLADKNGWTPLHFAAQTQETSSPAEAVEIAEMLLKAGANLEARDHHGNTPLMRAVFCSHGDGRLIRLLRKWGADPFAKNNHGVSPVELARTIANYDVARFFEDLPK
jgi:uncharacterized protein